MEAFVMMITFELLMNWRIFVSSLFTNKGCIQSTEVADDPLFSCKKQA